MGPDPFGDAFASALANAPGAGGGLDLEAAQQEIIDTLEQALNHMNTALPVGSVQATMGPGMTLPGQVTRQFGFERQSDGFEASAFSVTWGIGYPVQVRVVGGQVREVGNRGELVAALQDAMSASAPIARQLAQG
ncbi:MAG: hypothetical protein FJX74_16840 [Armatimonadetes bacterium]|nr:hypothetical protein [Armatimonadota bacterium]